MIAFLFGLAAYHLTVALLLVVDDWRRCGRPDSVSDFSLDVVAGLAWPAMFFISDGERD